MYVASMVGPAGFEPATNRFLQVLMSFDFSIFCRSLRRCAVHRNLAELRAHSHCYPMSEFPVILKYFFNVEALAQSRPLAMR